MTLNEFIEEELDRIRVFQIHWEIMNRSNSAHYPINMDPGEWDEQLMEWEP